MNSTRPNSGWIFFIRATPSVLVSNSVPVNLHSSDVWPALVCHMSFQDIPNTAWDFNLHVSQSFIDMLLIKTAMIMEKEGFIWTKKELKKEPILLSPLFADRPLLYTSPSLPPSPHHQQAFLGHSGTSSRFTSPSTLNFQCFQSFTHTVVPFQAPVSLHDGPPTMPRECIVHRKKEAKKSENQNV